MTFVKRETDSIFPVTDKLMRIAKVYLISLFQFLGYFALGFLVESCQEPGFDKEILLKALKYGSRHWKA